MRILLLTPRVPWPAVDGGRVAMSRLAESLARVGAEVEILSLNPRKHRVASPESAPVPIHAIDLDTSRILGPGLTAFFHGTPYVVERFHSNPFREALRAALQRFAPDIVQIESPFLLPYAASVRAEGGARVVLRSLNVEFRIWESLARNESHLFRRLALRHAATALREYETKHLGLPDAIVPISAGDREDFRRLGCTRPMHVAPCGVTLSDVREDVPGEEPEPGRVGFIGSLDFRPNQKAVRWIIDELWPRVLARMPTARLSIGGSSPPRWLRERRWEESIDFHSDIDDAEQFLRPMSAVIAPLFAGGGMRIKVLEAMAMGRAVVATTIGAGGIEVEHGRNIVIADDAPSFADGVVRLLVEPETAARIGRAARATVAARYDSDTIARDLLEFYASL
jgi:glycosyltransferase involved in cell wall biosynthesis